MSAPQFFLISLFERCACARRCNKLVVTLAVLLDYAPTHTFLTCTTLSVLFAESAKRLVAGHVHLVTAINTHLPISHHLTFLTFVRFALLRFESGGANLKLQNNIPDPCFNYTTKLHLSQVFGRLQSGSFVTFICSNVAECYVEKF